MAEKLGLDNKTRELKLGKSFDKGSTLAFHSIRYDFKPASVDTSEVSSVEVEENHSVTVTVPHVEGSGTSHTVYKGNKRPCQKECVLIIDHNTGEITLEKLANTVQLKKTRSEQPVKLQSTRPITPSDVKQSPKKKPSPSHSVAPGLPMNAPLLSAAPVRMSPKHAPVKGDSSSSSSGSDSSSSEDDDDDMRGKHMTATTTTAAPTSRNMCILSQDLALSESGSDSD